ncbi:MAG: hypothetical protein GX335_10685 [Firmicutes bacterium]|nr:hypothetical protein [Bacillota bacterium]
MIGTRNETALHASLKEHFRQPGDILEGKVDNFIIDLIQKERLVEIQTGNFTALKKKLKQLLADHAVHLVYPIAARRFLVYLDPETKEVLLRRKSPKKGDVYDLFSELIRIPHLICHANLTLEAVLVIEEEIRCDDGKGSWRRRGISVLDRRLVEVKEQVLFAGPQDYLDLIPPELPTPFSNRDLAILAGIPVRQARKVSYTLKKAGLLEEIGKRGREILHRPACLK